MKQRIQLQEGLIIVNYSAVETWYQHVKTDMNNVSSVWGPKYGPYIYGSEEPNKSDAIQQTFNNESVITYEKQRETEVMGTMVKQKTKKTMMGHHIQASPLN